MLVYRYINTPAGQFRSETVAEMSPHYLRNQAVFISREEQAICRDPMLMQLFEHRDRYCFPTLSFIYFFNNILTFSIEKYNESRIPLIDTSRYPITYTTETYCYTQPIPTTMQFNQQQSLNIHNIESVPVTSPPSPLSSLSNSSNIFRQTMQTEIDTENFNQMYAKLLTWMDEEESAIGKNKEGVRNDNNDILKQRKE